MPPVLLERAKKILPYLELTEWRWTITDVLRQPEPELEAVMVLKARGESIRKQAREEERAIEAAKAAAKDNPGA